LLIFPPTGDKIPSSKFFQTQGPSDSNGNITFTVTDTGSVVVFEESEHSCMHRTTRGQTSPQSVNWQKGWTCEVANSRNRLFSEL